MLGPRVTCVNTFRKSRRKTQCIVKVPRRVFCQPRSESTPLTLWRDNVWPMVNHQALWAAARAAQPCTGRRQGEAAEFLMDGSLSL